MWRDKFQVPAGGQAEACSPRRSFLPQLQRPELGPPRLRQTPELRLSLHLTVCLALAKPMIKYFWFCGQTQFHVWHPRSFLCHQNFLLWSHGRQEKDVFGTYTRSLFLFHLYLASIENAARSQWIRNPLNLAQLKMSKQFLSLTIHNLRLVRILILKRPWFARLQAKLEHRTVSFFFFNPVLIH